MGGYCDSFRKEVFSAIKGKGSFLNGQPIHVSNAEKLSDTMIGLETAKRELADENFARFRRGGQSVPGCTQDCLCRSGTRYRLRQTGKLFRDTPESLV